MVFFNHGLLQSPAFSIIGFFNQVFILPCPAKFLGIGGLAQSLGM